MTKHDYIILAMVVAGMVTNFLGAAFTIARVLSLLRRRAAGGSTNVSYNGNIELTDFAFSFSELRMKLKSIRSLHEFAELFEKHAFGHGIGASVVIAAGIMTVAGIMAAAILAW
jgi:hypothetical protein